MYTIGEVVVHPIHGAGIIKAIESVKIDGEECRYYIFSTGESNLSVKIPVANSEEIGLRRIISREQADELLFRLHEVEAICIQNWNRRYRENIARLKTGELMEVACVVKGLMARESGRGLSTGEKKMLRSAKRILVSEIALAKNVDYNDIERQVDEALA